MWSRWKEFISLGNSHEFDEGFEAYYLGMEIADCPYETGGASNAEWIAGWFDAIEKHTDEGLFKGN